MVEKVITPPWNSLPSCFFQIGEGIVWGRGFPPAGSSPNLGLLQNLLEKSVNTEIFCYRSLKTLGK